MKNAARFAFVLALAGACLGWLPQEKGKRKMRMAAAPVPAGSVAQPV